MVSLCSHDCPGTYYVDQAGLNSKDFSSLCLSCIGIKGVHHHAQLKIQFFNISYKPDIFH